MQIEYDNEELDFKNYELKLYLFQVLFFIIVHEPRKTKSSLWLNQKNKIINYFFSFFSYTPPYFSVTNFFCLPHSTAIQ
jgi:hypothetical protein